MDITAIARQLAVASPAARGRAVRFLSTWLPSQPHDSISENDLLNLWDGLFFATWHAEKPSAILRIINCIAGLVETLPIAFCCDYFDAFVFTVRREWSGIDSSRIFKFYGLIRLFIRHLLHRMEKNPLDCGILVERLFTAVNCCPEDGFRCYAVELLFGEVKEVVTRLEVVELVIGMFIRLIEKSSDKMFVNKVKDNVFGRLLESGREMLRIEMAGERAEPGSEIEWFGKMCLVLGLSKLFFGSVSAAETLQSNRKWLFSLYEEFLILENDLVKSGVKITVGFEENGSCVEVSGTKVSDTVKEVEGEFDGGGSDDSDGDNESDRSSSCDKAFSLSSGVSAVLVSSEVNNVHHKNIDKNMVSSSDLTSSDGHDTSLLEHIEKSAVEAGVMTSASGKESKIASSCNGKLNNESTNNGASTSKNNGEESVKKVRFSMKSNLVWKPHNPMPPQSLRLPPSTTPRGSVLKKGVLPGPIKESPISVKIRKTKIMKKSKKGLKRTSTAKLLKMLQSPN